jgi:hypothetical protein
MASDHPPATHEPDRPDQPAPAPPPPPDTGPEPLGPGMPPKPDHDPANAEDARGEGGMIGEGGDPTEVAPDLGMLGEG